jgi:excisionase family DNA binding protein
LSRLEDLPAVLTPKEAAAALRLGRDGLYDLIAAGKLRATNIGRGRKPIYRIKRDDVISFINGDTEQGNGSARPSGKAAA